MDADRLPPPDPRRVLVLTRTEEGDVFTLEPGGRLVAADRARRMIAAGEVVANPDSLFPDAPSQTWSVK